MKLTRTILVLTTLAATAGLEAEAASININSPGTAYRQNFNSLAGSGKNDSWGNGTTLAGWYLFRQPAPGAGVGTYHTGTGSLSTSGFYSFGDSGSSDRALGGIGAGSGYFGKPDSGEVAGWIAVAFVNNSGITLSDFTVHWNGEQWHHGSGNDQSESMSFEYGFGDTFQSVADWIAPGGNFDWTSPVTDAKSAAVDGNQAGRVPDVGGTVNGHSWMNHKTLWLRWTVNNDVGSDHGLAIDDFSLSTPAAAVTDNVPFGWTAVLLLGIVGVSRRICPHG